MSTFTVTVTVGQDTISVQPDTQVMTTNDDVQWASANARRFSIEFDGAGPFADRAFDFAAARGKQRPRSKGRFKYTVVAEGSPGLRLDPIIVVDPPPTGEET